MQNKLQELTEKIYSEGVAKGNEEAEKIVSEAKQEAEQIIKTAKQKADQIIKEAEKKSTELDKNTKSELQLTGKQIINKTKQSITQIITGNVVSEPVKEAVKDKDFIKSVIEKIAANWNIKDASSSDLEVILPEAQKKELDNYFKKEAKELLNKGVSFNFSNGLKSGFQISPKDGGFKVSFSEPEFESYFKEYLRPKLVELLFGKNA